MPRCHFLIGALVGLCNLGWMNNTSAAELTASDADSDDRFGIEKYNTLPLSTKNNEQNV